MASFRLEVHYTEFDMQMENVFYYLDRNNTGTPHDLVDAFISACQTDLSGVLSASVTISGYKAVRVQDLEEWEETATTVGLIGGNALPPQCAALLQFKTKFANRSKKGRAYLPGVPESYQEGGSITGTYMTNLQAFAENLKFIVGSVDSYDLCIYSRKNGTYTVVETTDVNDYVCIQRRRGFGRGI